MRRAVVGVILGVLWLAVVYFALSSRLERYEDGSGLVYYHNTPVAGYCLPWRQCN